MPSWGFIVVTHCSTDAHVTMLHDSLGALHRHHPAVPIVLIDDWSPLPLQLDRLSLPLTVERSVLTPGAAEVLPYLYYFKNRYFDVAVILHDSMQLQRPLVGIDQVTTVKFIRYFTCHEDWPQIPEPETAYNRRHHIQTHEDLIHHLVSTQANDFLWEQFSRRYAPKSEWRGCFGVMSIIHHDFLRYLQEKTEILTLFQVVHTNRTRRAMETLFALACHVVTGESQADAYDGAWYPFEGTYFTKIQCSR